ncbi:MAG: LemA family protein [Alphaproteobacteria bacterium]|nr:LemA family protein [Alphaproteobacteria bacterium]MBP7758769.1 LemA family protein [Alphaproteobacteria bacterium]MBP7761797.1 LemA family protein [Alphaproteobacteria bacterium]MBP7903740.1 LemA family protein [Alphaproteobacteria bacterium]
MEWIVLAVVVVVALLMVMLYNRLVALRQTRNNAFSDIDVQLKQRYDLVPQLVETVKGYAAHEKQVFENVTNARAQVGAARGGNPESRMKAEGMFGGAIAGLLAVAENYPQLKADQNFQRLMDELSDIENKIAAARRFFNSATAEYNTATEQFPAVLIANSFGFKKEVFFELDEAEKAAVHKAPVVKF